MVFAPLASWMLAAWGRRRPPLSLPLILAIFRLTIRQRQPSDTEPDLRRDLGGQNCQRLRLRHGCEGGSRWNPRANISHTANVSLDSMDITIKKCKLLVTRHHGTFL